MNIYLDIETIPSQDDAIKAAIAETVTHPATMSKADTIAAWEAEKKPAAVEAEWLKTSLDGTYGQIACIGVAIDTDKPIVFSAAQPDHERIMLLAFMDLLSINARVMATHSRHDVGDVCFVGHNVIDFDLVFIRQRCMINGVTPHKSLPFDAKPWDNRVYDTMHKWSSKKMVSLDKLSRALRVGSKGDVSGSDVWPMYRDGRIAEIEAYCSDDVKLTRAVHRKMMFMGDA